MKKNIINILSAGIILASSILLGSCDPHFLDTTPSNRVSTGTEFSSMGLTSVSIMNSSAERPEHGINLPRLWT